MSTEIERADAVATTDLAIAGDQKGFTEQQRAALVSLGIEDAPEGDIDLFFHMSKRSGLDPFAKQIYMIGRRTKESVYDASQRKKVDRWVTKWTIQTGIDGFRVMGHRAARLNGDTLEVDAPLWCGKDGVWSDVWLGDGPPAAAKVTVRVNGQAFPSVALYSEYVQTYRTDAGEVPNSMWRKMPANQLRKCAEAAAWKLAYPQDFSGLVLEDAAQVIDESGASVSAPQASAGPRGVAGLKSRIASRSRKAIGAGDGGSGPSTAEPVTESSEGAADAAEPSPSAGDTPDSGGDGTSSASSGYASEHHIVTLAEALTDAGILSDKERGEWLSEQVGRKLSSFDDMTTAEVDAALSALKAQRAAQ